MSKEPELIEIDGRVRAVIYHSEDTGYTVIKLEAAYGETITAVGVIPYASPGENLHLAGTWSTHSSYGQQFKVQWAQRSMPSGTAAIFDYLAANTVKGVGVSTARQIVDKFGENALEVIESEPDKLTEIKGISLKKAMNISACFKKQAGVRLLMEFLMQHGLRPSLAMKLHKCYGDHALAALKDNPYIIAETMFGSEFSAADKLALGMGFEPDSPQRLSAAVLYALVHNLSNGHTFIPRDKLITATSALVKTDLHLCERGVEELEKSGRVICDQIGKYEACYLDELHEAETYVASRILEMAQDQSDLGAYDEKLIEDSEKELGITYAQRQREAVVAASVGKIMVLTGAPGTGKTTTVRAVLALFEKMNLKTALAAPTGRAAKRLSELTGADAVTIHRLLGAGHSGESDELIFEKNQGDPLEVDALILDESSMVDIMLARALLGALPDNCRLVLVGDVDQLPPVGPGNFFSDIIRSGVVPVIRLDEIFRQAGESAIIRSAHMINTGTMPDISDKSGDFFYLRKPGQEETVQTILDLCSRRLPENMGISVSDIQVLSSFKRSTAGTINLNTRLQETLNPPSSDKSEKKYGENIFRVGDKVMQIRNNYDIIWCKSDLSTGLGVFNGDIGIITDISTREEQLSVIYDDKLVKYDFDMLGEIELAYAMTVHKSQGSEYKAVIFVAHKGPPALLNRKILYTAVTRAKELFVAVGDARYIQAMVDNDRRQKRFSGLKFRLAGE